MVASPYAFLRGAASLMAEDFAGLPRTGIEPVICGDAHLGNFGFYASPERDLVFDLNDFDEAHPGPWEWDLGGRAASGDRAICESRTPAHQRPCAPQADPRARWRAPHRGPTAPRDPCVR